MNALLWLILDTIRETCTKKDSCEGCPCAGEYMSPWGKQYYCTIADIPSRWQTGIIQSNLDDMAKREE